MRVRQDLLELALKFKERTETFYASPRRRQKDGAQPRQNPPQVRAVQSDAIPAEATDAGDKGTDLLQSVPNSEASASASTELTEPRRLSFAHLQVIQGNPELALARRSLRQCRRNSNVSRGIEQLRGLEAAFSEDKEAPHTPVSGDVVPSPKNPTQSRTRQSVTEMPRSSNVRHQALMTRVLEKALQVSASNKRSSKKQFDISRQNLAIL